MDMNRKPGGRCAARTWGVQPHETDATEPVLYGTQPEPFDVYPCVHCGTLYAVKRSSLGPLIGDWT